MLHTCRSVESNSTSSSRLFTYSLHLLCYSQENKPQCIVKYFVKNQDIQAYNLVVTLSCDKS